jgi:hypothetical protein
VTVFNDPEIVRLLTTKCVPVATTVRDAKRQDADGEFFRKVTKSVPYSQSGACLFTADGEVLGAGGAVDKEGVLPLIQQALKEFKPPSKPYVLEPPGKVDEKNHKIIKPPEGALVVNCIMTYLAEPEESVHPRLVKLLPQTVAVDRLWILPDEAKALAEGEFPAKLKRRISRWHLIDNRNFNRNPDDCVKQFHIELAKGQLFGSFKTQFDSESPEGKKVVNELELLGFIESKNGKITRFDVVGKGSRVAGNSLRPYPVAFVFTLADEKHVAFRIPPYPVLAHSEAIYLRD